MIPVYPLIYGILIGGLFAVVGVGFTLAFGVMEIINLAHGSFVMLGAFTAFWLHHFGMSPILALPIGFVLMFLFGVGLQEGIFSYVIGKKEWHLLIFVLTFGLAMAIQRSVALSFGPSPRSFSYLAGSINIFGFDLPIARSITFIGSIITISLLFFFLYRTDIGRNIRAVAQSRETAEIMGINTRFVDDLTMGISAGTGAVAGVFISLQYSIQPAMWEHWTIIAFIVVVLGGMGNILGVLVGGVLLGILSQYGAYYLGSGFLQIIMFLVLLVALILRPTGLLEER